MDRSPWSRTCGWWCANGNISPRPSGRWWTDGASSAHPTWPAGTSPEQEAEAQRFAEARIAAQLSPEPVDEPETERLLQQAYVAAGLPPPQRILWLDGPLQLVALRASESVGASVKEGVWFRLRDSMRKSVGASVYASVGDSVWTSVYVNVQASVVDSVKNDVGESVRASVGESAADSAWDSLRAYYEAPRLALYRFFDEYLAHFNERVSGYWLGREVAMLVRRPTVLSRDARGRLHSATGTCIEYRDGWGISAWHGVRVPAKVILAPDQLRGQDWSTASNVEVRRVIQERIGERFVGELEGKRIDASPRGTLYEVDLHDDPERVAPLPGSVVL